MCRSGLDAVHQVLIVLSGLGFIDFVAGSDIPCDLFPRRVLNQIKGIFCSRLVQVQNRRSIDDQHAAAIRFDAQVQPVIEWIQDGAW